MKDNFESTITENLKPYKLPNNWKWFFWEDIMNSYQQGMIRSNNQLGEGNAEYLKMGDIDIKGTVNLDNLKRTKATVKEIKDFKLNNGDFLINVRNSLPLVGKTCVVDNIENRQILYNHMLVRIDNGNVEMNYFINAFLNIPSSKKLLDRIKEGTTTVIALYQRELNKLPIALPDNDTFTTIVDIYKKIRDKIEINNKINQELEAMAKTLYDYWFVQFDFPDKNGKPYKSSGGEMVFNEALKRDIPVGWEVKELASKADFKNGKGMRKELLSENGKIPVFGSNGIVGKTQKSLFDNPVIAIGRVGANYGEVHYSVDSCWITDNAVTSQPKNEEYLWWLLLTLKSINYSNIAGGSAQPLITQGKLKALNFPIPNSSLFDKFHKIANPIYIKINNTLKQNQKLSELRDWLLPMLMNGQVSVGGVEKEIDGLGLVAEENAKYGKG
jgi:type I restriction enzyme S subunit